MNQEQLNYIYEINDALFNFNYKIVRNSKLGIKQNLDDFNLQLLTLCVEAVEKYFLDIDQTEQWTDEDTIRWYSERINEITDNNIYIPY
jgi:hypothetical protein